MESYWFVLILCCLAAADIKILNGEGKLGPAPCSTVCSGTTGKLINFLTYSMLNPGPMACSVD